MPNQKNLKIPEHMRSRYDEIVGLIDAFCKAHLNDEYADLCRKMAAKLSRKRPSPLERGQAKVWAGAILYTIGRINFLFDKSQDPYMDARELCQLVGVSQSTASAKATEIMRMFGLMQMHPDWTLPSLIDQNPLVWMISVNGFVIDARYAPRHIQEEAYRLGLIPYIPDQREES
jgi:hypothetical protein